MDKFIGQVSVSTGTEGGDLYGFDIHLGTDLSELMQAIYHGKENYAFLATSAGDDKVSELLFPSVTIQAPPGEWGGPTKYFVLHSGQVKEIHIWEDGV